MTMSIQVPGQARPLREDRIGRGYFSKFSACDEGFEAPIVILPIAEICPHRRGGLPGRNVYASGYQANR